MRIFFIIAAIVAFSIAALLAFIGHVALLTIVGIGFVGAAIYAVAAIVTP